MGKIGLKDQIFLEGRLETGYLQRVAERIPMPDYMLEQISELMPKVMDQLMPHMIKDVVPLVSQPVIEYLKQ